LLVSYFRGAGVIILRARRKGHCGGKHCCDARMVRRSGYQTTETSLDLMGHPRVV
jgi:hypothetical protein